MKRKLEPIKGTAPVSNPRKYEVQQGAISYTFTGEKKGRFFTCVQLSFSHGKSPATRAMIRLAAR